MEPPTRWLHAAATISCGSATCMVIFGGCSVNLLPLNDVWLFDTTSKLWQRVQPPAKQLPPGRWLHTMVGVRAPDLAAPPPSKTTRTQYDLHVSLLHRRKKGRYSTSERTARYVCPPCRVSVVGSVLWSHALPCVVIVLSTALQK